MGFHVFAANLIWPGCAVAPRQFVSCLDHVWAMERIEEMMYKQSVHFKDCVQTNNLSHPVPQPMGDGSEHH